MTSNRTITRRHLIQTTAGAGLAAASGMLAAPALAQSRSIKIGSYGGYFEDTHKDFIYPEFEKATGIKVESITQPDSTSWLQTMIQAKAAGNIPADISMHTALTILKAGRIGDILKPLDASKISTLGKVKPELLYEHNGALLSVAANSYFASMVINTDEVETPTSWADFWDSSRFEASLGLPKNVSFNFLDIAAATFFNGAETLSTHDGITAVIEKVAELHPNVALWYSAESQMEQALKNFDVVAGMYFHDVAGLMASDGHPIASIFPKEGNILNHNSWTLTEGSEKSDEAHEFIAFSSEPATQAIMARNIGLAPVVDPALTDLTAEELGAVAGTPTITPAYTAYLDDETFITETWDRMVAKA